MREVALYTDGACSGNPGKGGYGAILSYCGHEKVMSGGFSLTTNNRMELLAAIVGLEALKEPCKVTLYSDSKYLVDAVQKGWVYSWKKRGWKKSDGKPALNRDLWERLLNQFKTHEVSLVWVKGHAGHEYNERCDTLAFCHRLVMFGRDVCSARKPRCVTCPAEDFLPENGSVTRRVLLPKN